MTLTVAHIGRVSWEALRGQFPGVLLGGPPSLSWEALRSGVAAAGPAPRSLEALLHLTWEPEAP